MPLGSAQLGTEKTPLSLLLHNRRVYRFLLLNDSCMAEIRSNIYSFTCRRSRWSLVKSPAPCRYLLFTVALQLRYTMYSGTHTMPLTPAAHVTTASSSLQWSYAWRPPSLSLIYFLCRASLLPMSPIFAFSLFFYDLCLSLAWFRYVTFTG
jgi:hypothetical protein